MPPPAIPVTGAGPDSAVPAPPPGEQPGASQRPVGELETPGDPAALEAFIRDVVLPREALYFTPAIGLEPRSAWPFDHVRIRLDEQVLAEVGRYTAASKVSLAIPVLVGIAARKPGYERMPYSPATARRLLEAALRTYEEFAARHPEYRGFVPWGELSAARGLHPTTAILPALDNGQLTWALAGLVGALERSSEPDDQALARRAQALLDREAYGLFYDPHRGLLRGTMQLDPVSGAWLPITGYYLNDMFEGSLAVLWAVIQGQVPEAAWEGVAIPTVDYRTREGDTVTTLAGYRGSFHEHWGLAYLPFMRSALAPLYRNYLHAQADFAVRTGLPGFLATAYDSRGSYRQMGVPALAQAPVDRSDVATVYGTAMAMLIDPVVGAAWLGHVYRMPGLVGPYGAVEAVGRDGYADVFTADAKGMTIVAATGGIVDDVEAYLSRRTVPGGAMTLRNRLMALLDRKAAQALAARQGRPLHLPRHACPLPSGHLSAVRVAELPRVGPRVPLAALLQPGHLHGKNVRSVGRPVLDDDVRPGGALQFAFDIPASLPPGDQWAFRGTFLSQAVRIAEMRYLTIAVPADSPPCDFDIELKRDDTILAIVPVDTRLPGVLSADGRWKRLTMEMSPVLPESRFMPLNWVGVSIHDPAHRRGELAAHARSGELCVGELVVSEEPPASAEHAPRAPVPLAPGELQLLEGWSPRGPLSGAATHDRIRHVWRIPGGGTGSWGWNYVPVRRLRAGWYINLKLRNLSGLPNELWVELKHDDEGLIGAPLYGTRKVRVTLPSDDAWHLRQIRIPSGIERALNVIALSDMRGDLELSSAALARAPIAPE